MGSVICRKEPVKRRDRGGRRGREREGEGKNRYCCSSLKPISNHKDPQKPSPLMWKSWATREARKEDDDLKVSDMYKEVGKCRTCGEEHLRTRELSESPLWRRQCFESSIWNILKLWTMRARLPASVLMYKKLLRYWLIFSV